MDFVKLCIDLLLETVGLQHLNLGYKGVVPRHRRAVEEQKVYVCIHEWGGYPQVRQKHINSTICDWECGLKYQLERFENRQDVVLTVTMSDAHRSNDIAEITTRCDHFIAVPNRGMDFSGYGAFYQSIRGLKNCYVLLTNSSVNSLQSDFLDSYIDYMERNTDVGMLGVSCCSKCYQTLVQNNFTPHLQSFFLLTTLDVLTEVVALNGGQFPGAGICNKQLLIRRGEIRISQLVLQLGYKLAVVTEFGVAKFDNNPKNWTLPYGDFRAYTDKPNAIHPI